MARTPIGTLSRYLLRQHVGPFAFAMGFLIGMLLLSQVAKRFNDFVGKGLPWSIVAEFFLLAVPWIVALTLPMAVLVAVLHTWSRLAQSNEYTALLASGVSPLRLASPVLLAGILVTAVALIFNDQFLPKANHELRQLTMDISRKKPNFALKEQVVNEVTPGRLYLRTARIVPGSDQLIDVEIHDLQAADQRRVIYAASGSFAYSPNLQDLYLTLEDGVIHEFSRRDTDRFQRTFFAKNVIRVTGVSNVLERTEEDDFYSDRELSICEMDDRIAQAERRQFVAAESWRRALRNASRARTDLPLLAKPDTLSLRGASPSCQLSRVVGGSWLLPPAAEAQTVQSSDPEELMDDLRLLGQQRLSAERDAARYTVEVHKKLTLSAACFVFVLIGIPVALRFPQAGAGLVMGVSIAVFGTYYIGIVAGEDLADRTFLDPALSMWVANLVYLTIGLWSMWRLQRRGVVAHGRSDGLLSRLAHRRHARRSANP